MSSPALNPLTQQQIDELKQAKSDAEQGLAQTALAKKAGIDVSAQEEELTSQLNQIKGLLDVYGKLPPKES